MFYINAKQKQKDFAEKKGESEERYFHVSEEKREEEKHQNILVKFS